MQPDAKTAVDSTLRSQIDAAVAAGDIRTLQHLHGGSTPSKDTVVAVAESLAASSSVKRADADAVVCSLLSRLAHRRSRSGATDIFLPNFDRLCADNGWCRSAHVLARLQSVTESVMLGILKQQVVDAAVLATAISTRAEPEASDDDAEGAVMRILEDLLDTAVEATDASIRIAARAAAHEVLTGQVAAGSMASVAESHEYPDILSIAAKTGDVDLVLALARAGVQQQYECAAGLLHPEDVFHSLLLNTCIEDAHGAPVDDERLAEYFMQMYRAGVRVPPCHPHGPGVMPGDCTWRCVQDERIACLRVLVSQIDPHAHEPVECNEALLHYAASARRPAACAALIEEGFNVDACSSCGWTPLALAIMPRPWRHQSTMSGTRGDSLSATLRALLGAQVDVRRAIRTCGVCDTAYANDIWDHWPPLGFDGSLADARVVLHVCAAVRDYPAAPRMALTSMEGSSMLTLCVVREEALDVRCENVYIPDPFRVSMLRREPIAYAVRVDAIIAAMARVEGSAVRWRDELRRDFKAALLASYESGTLASGVSATLQSWAYMRRKHALLNRHQVLRAL